MMSREQMKEHIDELLMLEEKAEQRAEKLSELIRSQEKAHETILSHVNVIDEVAKKIGAASDQIQGHVAQCKAHSTATTRCLLWAMVVCAAMMGVSALASYEIYHNTKSARKELAYLRGDIEFERTMKELNSS